MSADRSEGVADLRHKTQQRLKHDEEKVRDCTCMRVHVCVCSSVWAGLNKAHGLSLLSGDAAAILSRQCGTPAAKHGAHGECTIAEQGSMPRAVTCSLLEHTSLS